MRPLGHRSGAHRAERERESSGERDGRRLQRRLWPGGGGDDDDGRHRQATSGSRLAPLLPSRFLLVYRRYHGAAFASALGEISGNLLRRRAASHQSRSGDRRSKKKGSIVAAADQPPRLLLRFIRRLRENESFGSKAAYLALLANLRHSSFEFLVKDEKKRKAGKKRRKVRKAKVDAFVFSPLRLTLRLSNLALTFFRPSSSCISRLDRSSAPFHSFSGAFSSRFHVFHLDLSRLGGLKGEERPGIGK